jgi:hypothetical protein
VVGAVDVVGVDVVGVVAGVVAVELLVAADAPAMPATAPPVARAPATIVAWSILDIRIRWDLLQVGVVAALTHHGLPC